MSDNGYPGKDNLAVSTAKEKYEIVLPCEPAQFGQFISGLLGKPQIIETFIDGIFEI